MRRNVDATANVSAQPGCTNISRMQQRGCVRVHFFKSLPFLLFLKTKLLDLRRAAELFSKNFFSEISWVFFKCFRLTHVS
jgi:hypothetical protein